MKSSAKNINLTSVDDLFTTEESRIDENREKVQEIPLSELYTFKDHPFKVIDNEAIWCKIPSAGTMGVSVMTFPNMAARVVDNLSGCG